MYVITRQEFDFAEQSGVSNGHPRCNSRIYPRFPLQLEKSHETSPSAGVKARIPCIGCRAIPSSQSNTKGASMCLMEHQRVPKKTVTWREEHCCHSGMQNSSVYPKSNRDEAHFPFIGSIAIPCSTSYRTSGLTSFSKLQRLTETPVSGLYEY